MPLTTEQILFIVKDFRKDYYAFGANRYGTVPLLCSAYNWATNPARHTTDREHRLLRTFAHWCRQRLDRIGHYHETESGRCFPR